MEEKFFTPERVYDPSKWEFHVRHSGGGWLCRPAKAEGEAPSNQEVWSRRLADIWPFDTRQEAIAAAASHGASIDDITVHAAPRDPGAWLKGYREVA